MDICSWIDYIQSNIYFFFKIYTSKQNYVIYDLFVFMFIYVFIIECCGFCLSLGFAMIEVLYENY